MMSYALIIHNSLFIYQLALFNPGIFPSSAISRKAILEMPKYRTYPFGRPLIWQRFFNLTLEEFFGSSSNAFQSPAFLSSLRFSAYWATILSLFFCLAVTDVFAMLFSKFQILKFQIPIIPVGIWNLYIVIYFLISLKGIPNSFNNS